MNVMNNLKVEDLFEELKSLGLTAGQFPEYVDWETYVQKLDEVSKENQEDGETDEDASLKKILDIQVCPERISKLTLKDITSKGFAEAKRDIDLMPIEQRISILSELEEYRNALYESVSAWGDKDNELSKVMTAENFRTLLGKIKHLEILQNWLYGIE